MRNIYRAGVQVSGAISARVHACGLGGAGAFTLLEGKEVKNTHAHTLDTSQLETLSVAPGNPT